MQGLKPLKLTSTWVSKPVLKSNSNAELPRTSNGTKPNDGFYKINKKMPEANKEPIYKGKLKSLFNDDNINITANPKGRASERKELRYPKRGHNYGRHFNRSHLRPVKTDVKSIIDSFNKMVKQRDKRSFDAIKKLSTLLEGITFESAYAFIGTSNYLQHVPGYYIVISKPDFHATRLLLPQILRCKSNVKLDRLVKVIDQGRSPIADIDS
jgi:hypothetical protein